MVLATYICGERDTWLHDRYDYIKDALGIPLEKEIYWCFTANTVEQAVINSFLIAGSQPKKFILFETDNYQKVDKIKWTRFLEETEIPDEKYFKEILSPEFEDATEYIVTELPEKRFELSLDLSDLDAYLEKTDLTEFQKSCLHKFVTDKNDSNEYKGHYNFLLESVMKLMGPEEFPDIAFEAERLGCERSYAMKMMFPVDVLPKIYPFAKAYIGIEETRRTDFTMPKAAELLDYHNTYETWNITVPKVKNKAAHEGLMLVCEYLCSNIFYANPFEGAKIKPNEPCPCGSGKKYKKCCSRAFEFNIHEILTDTESNKGPDERAERILAAKEKLGL